MVKPSKWVISAAAVAGLVCLAAGVLHAARTQQGTEIHVQKVELPTFFHGGIASIPYAHVHVTIVDQAGQPVEGAKVWGKYTGCRKGGGSATTDSFGVAHIDAGARKCGCTYTFEVTGVSKSGASYDPLANEMTSGSRCYCDCP